MKDYTKYILETTDEIIIARLFALNFDSFQELDNHIEAYIEDDLLTSSLREEVDNVCKSFGVSYTVEQMENKNWNEIWESNFDPVQVGDFCRVRADFHDADDRVKFDLVINPKMAFGTGHHETTYMMIDTMSELDFKSKSVFDFGCGTAVLAILAKCMDAGRTLAIDIEEESASNSQENAEVNSIEGIDIRQATIDQIDPEKFDIILANINRQVLLDTADMIATHQNSGNILLVSGVMQQDEDIVESRFQAAGYKREGIKNKGEWLCIHYSRI